MKTTILFGAGASYPFYKTHLSTNYITSQVKQEINWQDMLSNYRHVNVEEYQEPDIMFWIDFLNGSGNEDLNFEQLAEIVDKISSVQYDCFPQDNMLNRIVYALNANLQHRTQAQYIPFFFREIIANIIIEQEMEGRMDNYEELQRLQQQLLKRISENSDQASVISLNYDECVPVSIDAIHEYDNCFRNERGHGDMELDVRRFFETNKVVYYPHGHLRLVFNDKENVVYIPDIREAEQKRWNGLFNQGSLVITQTPFCYDFNTFITTGQTKDNAFNNMPYAVYYQRMAIDFLTSDLIVLIGYSFGDPHFNRLLKSFHHINDINKVLVVDMYPEAVTMLHEYRDTNNLIAKINQTFTPGWGIRVTNDGEMRPMNQEEINHVNQDGFGEILPRVYFFKNGYEEFLNRQEKVLGRMFAL